MEDINYSLQLDQNNSYAYRNLGIYFFDKKEYKQAYDLFTKAKQLDANTLMIEDLLIDVKRKLETLVE